MHIIYLIVPLAQRIARWTSNPKVLGSIPRWDDMKHFWLTDIREVFFFIKTVVFHQKELSVGI